MHFFVSPYFKIVFFSELYLDLRSVTDGPSNKRTQGLIEKLHSARKALYFSYCILHLYVFYYFVSLVFECNDDVHAHKCVIARRPTYLRFQRHVDIYYYQRKGVLSSGRITTFAGYWHTYGESYKRDTGKTIDR